MGGHPGSEPQAPLLLNPLEPYDDIEFDTRRFARLIRGDNGSSSPLDWAGSDNSGPHEEDVNLEFNTVCPGVFPPLPTAAASSTTAPSHTILDPTAVRTATLLKGAPIEVRTAAPTAVTGTRLVAWTCHVCGASHDDCSSSGSGSTRTVCSVCLSRRTPPHPSDAAWRRNANNWVCGSCDEVNCRSSSSSASSTDGVLWTSGGPSSRINVLDDGEGGGGGDDGGDDDAPQLTLQVDRCRCCGDVPPLPDASLATADDASSLLARASEGVVHLGRGGGAGPNNVHGGSGARGHISKRSRPSNDAAAAAFAIFANPRTDTRIGDTFRVQDVLQRWRCIGCSLSLKNTTRVCPRCHVDRLDTSVSCPMCRFSVGLTTRDVMERSKCPQCAHPLHGAAVSNFPSMWICTCGATAKASLCPRCRAPKHLPDGQEDASRFMTTWDFELASNWFCSSCAHINAASVKKLVARRGAWLTMDVVNGQHACGACHEQWHVVMVNGGSQWRCACQRLNPIGQLRCSTCSREVSNLSCATNSFWMPGDWICPTCARHNFRLKSMCLCGASQPK